MANEDETETVEAVDDPKTAEPAAKRVAPYHYIVREPFGDYRKGNRLTDAEAIDAVHKDGHASKLIRVSADPDFVEA